ncbi:MAG: hypothetical protein RR400_02535 [Clostridia bacterium]
MNKKDFLRKLIAQLQNQNNALNPVNEKTYNFCVKQLAEIYNRELQQQKAKASA